MSLVLLPSMIETAELLLHLRLLLLLLGHSASSQVSLMIEFSSEKPGLLFSGTAGLGEVLLLLLLSIILRVCVRVSMCVVLMLLLL